MQKLIANYLFQYGNCALSQIGTLHTKSEPSVSVFGVQKIDAPLNHILFSNDITDSKNLTEYIAVNKNISFEEAAYQLKNISSEILNLKEEAHFSIPGVGVFTKSQNDKLSFKEIKTDNFFTPPVYAERVIHPDDSHAILVGDKETDRNTMTELLTETVPIKKNKWWIWAAAFFVLSIVLIFVYLNNETQNKSFGISHKYEMNETSPQYKNIP